MGNITTSQFPANRRGAKAPIPGASDQLPAQSTSPATSPPSSPLDAGRNPYRWVIFVLLLMVLLGTAVAIASGVMLANPVLLDAGVALGLSTGILLGVAAAQAARARPVDIDEEISIPESVAEQETPSEPKTASKWDVARVSPRLTALRVWISTWLKNLGPLGIVRVATAAAGTVGILLVLWTKTPGTSLPLLKAGIAAALCLGAAGLAAMGARYFANIDFRRLPEAPGLCRGARVIAWILVLSAISVGLEWAGLATIVQILHYAVLIVDAFVCYGLFMARVPSEESLDVFPLDFGILSALGSRPNILASVLDSAERQLGIDLRSTWALTIVRQTLEPLLIGLCLLGWLTTCATVVGVDEQGLVEHLGVPVGGEPLQPGLHLHWPWPVDQVFRIPVQRVQIQQIGHEGEEAEGPENVLWAVEHAPNEYTLVLGNGRDLITVDAALQYRITNPRAWHYNSQNPADALRAIAYRAVMRSTVDRTLSDALSQNVSILTAQIRDMVQKDADSLGLGVQVLGFTVGGMHPPVPVAPDYEAVVSAEISKVTMVVNAQVHRNQTVPATEALALVQENAARAQGANDLAKAAGEAWSFRTLESQYRASPEEYFFRRRLETLEKGLASKSFIVVDSRIQRDGGELWLTQ